MREAVFDIHDEIQQLNFGETLAKSVDNKACVIFLQGDLGSGKTTLTRGFLRAMGYADKVKSPTYTLIEVYDFSAVTVLHIDLYRLNNASEIEALSLRDYLQNNKAIFIIEWPEKASEKLPRPDLVCELLFHRNGRRLKFSATTLRGEEILQHMDSA